MVEIWSWEKSTAGSVFYISGYGCVNLLVSDVRASGATGAEIEFECGGPAFMETL